jgi:hypothetical protein
MKNKKKDTQKFANISVNIRLKSRVVFGKKHQNVTKRISITSLKVLTLNILIFLSHVIRHPPLGYTAQYEYFLILIFPPGFFQAQSEKPQYNQTFPSLRFLINP